MRPFEGGFDEEASRGLGVEVAKNLEVGYPGAENGAVESARLSSEAVANSKAKLTEPSTGSAQGNRLMMATGAGSCTRQTIMAGSKMNGHLESAARFPREREIDEGSSGATKSEMRTNTLSRRSIANYWPRAAINVTAKSNKVAVAR